jgi:hypothetical protein
LKFACMDHSGAYWIGCWISHRSTASLLVLKSLGAAARITRRHSGGGPRTEKKIPPFLHNTAASGCTADLTVRCQQIALPFRSWLRRTSLTSMNVLTELFRGDFKVASWRKAQPPWQARDEKRVMGAARIYTIWNPISPCTLTVCSTGSIDGELRQGFDRRRRAECADGACGADLRMGIPHGDRAMASRDGRRRWPGIRPLSSPT